MRSVKIMETTEKINSESGLFPVGRLLCDLGLDRFNRFDVSATKPVEISTEDMVKSYVGSLCTGRKDFSDIERFRGDTTFHYALGVNRVPGEGVLRQRLEAKSPVLEPMLDTVIAEQAWGFSPTPVMLSDGKEYTVLDVDVSVHDNSGTRKEGVEYSYREVAGYAPIYAYAGEEGYLLGGELRPGSRHCQCGTAEFLRRLLGTVPEGVRMLLRMDSGNDAAENFQVAEAARHKYIVAANRRGIDTETLKEDIRLFGEQSEPEPGVRVYTYRETVFTEGPRGGTRRRYRIARLVERDIDKNGEKLLLPDETLSLWWTNLALPAAEIIRLYRDHGTSEQYHSEIKSDLDLERLPSSSFACNHVALKLGMIAYNLLRRLGVDAVRHDDVPRLKRRRIRTVITEIIRMAGKLVETGNRLILRIYHRERYLPVLKRLYHAYG